MERSDLVIVTGASGLIGSRVVRDLSTDFNVVGIDVVRPEGLPEGVSHLSADLTDDEAVRKAFQRIRDQHGTAVASLVHLAAYYDFSGEPSPLYDELTVEGSRRVARIAREVFERVEQIVFSSSTLVMRPAEPGQIITEESPRLAQWDYPKSKIEAEDTLAQARGGAKLTVLRIAGVYDKWGHSPPITQQLWRIAENRLEGHLFPGDADSLQHYVHIDDAVAAIRAAVEHREELDEHEVFLIAEPRGVSYRELQDAMGRLVWGTGWTTVQIPPAIARAGAAVENALDIGDPFIKPWMIPLADDSYPMSVERARTRLGWQARHALLDDLPAMIKTLKSHPDRFYEVNGLPGAPARKAS